ncbi:hypothetical protein LZU85_12960 [Vibrio sp. IRLE0018]|uniref:COG3014 family protein n=1 Tax=Vibrio TaxID=662 RepID=UPI0015932D40|nr:MULTISPECIES: hypothetical protein [Vibrio]EIJ0954407.1 hypothetical protein [Vibrio vulnificus]EIJ0958531.1 hypothetical protein [Vibrio vulnificus]EIJ0986177.1 hypothetical protein [Vibrio vulnificus]MCF8779713.1 hypothetical protein [Vibrio floridensis]
MTGCANMSAGNLFSHYSQQNRAVYQAVKSGHYSQAIEAQTEGMAGNILDNMERGRVAFLSEDYPESKTALEASDVAVREWQDLAKISLSQTATSIGSLAVNDNLNNYTPADYELGFLHLYLGLNYLQQNSLEGALVEMRRANQVQEAARKVREDDLQSAERDMQKNGMSTNLGSVLANYPDAGKTLQSVQNGYLFFLSGLLYEASKDLNGAYVDYRRALAVSPNNPAVIERTMLVAKKLGMREDLAKLEKHYGKHNDTLEGGQGRVIVIEEQGVVEALQGWRIDLPVYDSRGVGALYSLALPYYPSQNSERFAPLRLNQKALESHLLVDVDQMAKYDLSERLPSMVIRQALRVVAKDQLRKEAAQGDDVGNLLFNVWNALTEQPDTRSWQTLPAKVNVMTTVLRSGEQTLTSGDKDYLFTVADKQTTLVWISRQGNNQTVWHKQLGRL